LTRQATARIPTGTLALLLAMLAIYTLTSSAQLHSDDELGVLAVTASLVRHGTLDANAASRLWEGAHNSIVIPGSDGTFYSVKGVLTSLLAAPLYALGLRLPAANPVSVALLLGPLQAALAVAVLFIAARHFGYEGPIALAGALIFGLATPAFAYSGTLFTGATASLCLVAALALTDAAARRASPLLAALFLRRQAIEQVQPQDGGQQGQHEHRGRRPAEG
jgi:hypothetical protein